MNFKTSQYFWMLMVSTTYNIYVLIKQKRPMQAFEQIVHLQKKPEDVDVDTYVTRNDWLSQYFLASEQNVNKILSRILTSTV